MAERKAEWKTYRRRGEGIHLAEKNGRHEETRTPDLYRVNLPKQNAIMELSGFQGSERARSEHCSGLNVPRLCLHDCLPLWGKGQRTGSNRNAFFTRTRLGLAPNPKCWSLPRPDALSLACFVDSASHFRLFFLHLIRLH
jgi:hypothetical protein